jgi:cytoskeletal protein RodZ
MTDTAKTTLWVIIILVLVGVIWWFVGSNPDQQNPLNQPAVVQEVEIPVATTTEPVVVEDASTSISVQDKTDATLEMDLSKVDEQLKALKADSAN